MPHDYESRIANIIRDAYNACTKIDALSGIDHRAKDELEMCHDCIDNILKAWAQNDDNISEIFETNYLHCKLLNGCPIDNTPRLNY